MILLSIPTSGQHRRRRREAEAAVNDGLVHFRHFQTKKPLISSPTEPLVRSKKTRGCIKCVILFGFRNFQADFLIPS